MSPRAHFLFSLLLAHPAHAHDLWIERDGSVHTLAYGHERSSHEGAKTLEYKPESVKRSACFDAAGKEIAAKQGHSYPATLAGDCAASWFLVSSGHWSKTPYGTKNLPKEEAGAMVIASWLSLESVKRIDRWGAELSRPLAQDLELAPEDDPLKLQAGDKLRLRVWYRGKPAAGVTVAYFGKPRGVTDGVGKVNIRLRNPGLQLIEASLELPLNDGKADKAVYSSSLQFETQ